MSVQVPLTGEPGEHSGDLPCNREVSEPVNAPVLAPEALRKYTEDLTGYVPLDATVDECIAKIDYRIGWLNNIWQACHNRHLALERPALVVVDPTPAESALAASLGASEGHLVTATPACAGSPDRKEQG